MARSLEASPAQIQQTITAYMLPFGLMVLWHGALSDAVGRRRMILAGLALFSAGSLCARRRTSSTCSMQVESQTRGRGHGAGSPRGEMSLEAALLPVF